MSYDNLDVIDRVIANISIQKYKIESLNFLRIIKCTERYYFVYDDDS
jgi:hypothetical protein